MEARSMSQAKLLQAVQAIRHGLEGMMASYYARAPRSSIGLDETAEAICESSGIPNPALFRMVLRRTISSLSGRPELLSDGYHVMSCIIWVFCFLQPKPMVMSVAKLYTSDPERKLISPEEVRTLLQDIMLNDPKKEQQTEEPPKHCEGLQEYSTAVARISQSDTSSVRRLSSTSENSEDVLFQPEGSMTSAESQSSATSASSIDDLPADPIDIGVFIRYFTKRHPGALWPLFIIQKQLRSMFLGEDYWRKILQPRNVAEFFRMIAITDDNEMFTLPEQGAAPGEEVEPQISPSARSTSSSSTSPRSIWLKMSADSDLSPTAKIKNQDLVNVLCAVLSHLQDVLPAKTPAGMRRTHSQSSMSARHHHESSRRERSASPRRRSKSHHAVPTPSSSESAGSGSEATGGDGDGAAKKEPAQEKTPQRTRPHSLSAPSRPRLQSSKRYIMRDDTEPNSPVYSKDLSKEKLRQQNRSDVQSS